MTVSARTRGAVAARASGVRGRGAVAVLAAAGLAVAAAGCGASSPDLFVLTRTGSIPGAHLTLLVNDGGTVRCNGAKRKTLPDPRLVDARNLTDGIANDAKANLRLPTPPDSVLQFHIRSQDGTVTFADTDAATRPELAGLVEFSRRVARNVCGLAR